jgi:predicted AlkP superfamily pyrophosphatase or phosphodiesterase
MRRILSAAALTVAMTVLATAADTAPKLVVVLVVDQMRADYVERFRDNWSSGLRRLVDDGAWFTKAAYPYLSTLTCAGHATIGTGAFPHRHGIFANAWYDRSRAAVIPCTDDQSARAVPYGRAGNSRTGPGQLLVPSLADRMRLQGGHVVTLALKARSAVMLAGHGGDAVSWISESLDGWESSTAFTPTPIPQVKAFLAANPMDADYGKTWTHLLPASAYKDADDGLGEAPIRGWTSTFPHMLMGDSTSTTADTSYYDQWQHSPYADAYVARMAASLVESMELGKHASADFLGVSFSSPDLVGHSYGPRSQEVQDMYAHLDASIGGLLNALDRLVGPGQYVLALSADHGVSDIPEQRIKAGRDAGRISASAVLNAGEARAEAQMGREAYLARLNGNEVYFAPGMYDKVIRRPNVLKDIVKAMEQQPGVAKVYTADELGNGGTSSDAQLRAAALSYVPGRSGDLVISPKPGWMFAGNGTTHGSASPDDQRVPILLYGFGIKPGHYDGAATPADIAPTLASIAGVTLPNADGSPLKDALR